MAHAGKSCFYSLLFGFRHCLVCDCESSLKGNYTGQVLLKCFAFMSFLREKAASQQVRTNWHWKLVIMSFNLIITSVRSQRQWINWAQWTCAGQSDQSPLISLDSSIFTVPFSVCGTNTVKWHMLSFIWNISWHSTASLTFSVLFDCVKLTHSTDGETENIH